MKRMEVDDLEKHVREVLRQVQEDGETIEIVNDQAIIARLIPVHQPEPGEDSSDADMTLEELRAEISKYRPKGVSAVDAVRDVRREL